MDTTVSPSPDQYSLGGLGEEGDTIVSMALVHRARHYY